LAVALTKAVKVIVMAGLPLAGASASVWLPESIQRTRPSMTSGGAVTMGGWDAASDVSMTKTRPTMATLVTLVR